MLERQIATNGVVTYQSPILHSIGVRHAFSTRLGGISKPPFDALNLGNPNGCAVQDGLESIADNYALIQKAIGCGRHELCRVHQVHGASVAWARPGQTFDQHAKADAILSTDPERVVSVRIADCVPVLLASCDGRIVAAIHAGWRGVVARVAVAGLRELCGDERTPSGVVAAIGPSISQDAFEVGPEVASDFLAAFPDDADLIRRGTGDRQHIDLQTALVRQLHRAGVPREQIDITDRCTYRDRVEFFSHRRDHGVTGRMAALVAANA